MKNQPTEFHGRVGIVTKYHGPTNHRGARISARRSDHTAGDKSVTVNWDYSLSSIDNYARAALGLVRAYESVGWILSEYAVSTETGYIFTVENFQR